MYLSQRFFVQFAVAMLVCLATILSVAEGSAGQCLNDSREIKFTGQDPSSQNKKSVSVRFRDYYCNTQFGDVRVQFNRIDDRTMGRLVAGVEVIGFKNLFENGRLLKNSVFKEYNKLLKLFGKIDQQYSDKRMAVTTPTGSSIELSIQDDNRSSYKVLVGELLANPNVAWTDFPQPDALQFLDTHSKLPTKFKGSPKEIVWTYLKKSDARKYEKYVQRENKLIARSTKDQDEIYLKPVQKPKAVEMLEYLARDGWPKFLAVIMGVPSTVQECYPSWGYFRRLPIIDVMVIQNLSGKSISVDALLGARSPTTGLRAQSRSNKLRSALLTRLAGNLGTLAPGQKLIVPTRITFTVNPRLKSDLQALTDKPKYVNYVYGPEVAVRSLVISGEQLDLEGNSSNFLQLTTSCECGSCPYLYAYDEQARDWRKLGKVIHKAKGKDREETEIRELDGLVTKYRLAEEEAELAYIDHVSLTLELKNGKKLEIEPSRILLKRKDGLYRRIYFGQMINVQFPVPNGLKPTEVKTSRFSVTGYYDRYSDILLQSNLAPVYSPVMLGK